MGIPFCPLKDKFRGDGSLRLPRPAVCLLARGAAWCGVRTLNQRSPFLCNTIRQNPIRLFAIRQACRRARETRELQGASQQVSE
jgi:hypothetical protein